MPRGVRGSRQQPPYVASTFAERVLGRGIEATRRKKAAGEMKPYRIDPTTTEREYQSDELEFMFAMDEYKRIRNRPFPTWSEVLVVLKSLGYRKADPE